MITHELIILMLLNIFLGVALDRLYFKIKRYRYRQKMLNLLPPTTMQMATIQQVISNNKKINQTIVDYNRSQIKLVEKD